MSIIAITDKKISITTAASRKIQEILKPEEVFRIKIEPGGCNGFEYYFTTEKYLENSEDYTIQNNDKIFLIVDNTSISLLTGSILDYETELIGEKFSIKNPNSKSSCSCGASFGL